MGSAVHIDILLDSAVLDTNGNKPSEDLDLRVLRTFNLAVYHTVSPLHSTRSDGFCLELCGNAAGQERIFRFSLLKCFGDAGLISGLSSFRLRHVIIKIEACLSQRTSSTTNRCALHKLVVPVLVMPQLQEDALGSQCHDS